MTCKDCVHYEACEGTPQFYDDEYIKDVTFSGDVRDLCPTFKNKADFVEVVRCKDCIHNADNGGDCDRVLIHTHRNLITETNEYQCFKLNHCEYGTPKERGGEK